MDTATIATPELIQRQRNMRINPLRSLTALSLTRALDAFNYGDLREGAQLWEAIAERDDTIPGVKAKREKSTAQLEWKVIARDDSPEAAKHKETLEAFWAGARAVNAYDRNERGGISRLIRQMMSAVSFKYAVHHIVWRPRPGQLGATFEFVPLWFFENRTGTLRFIRDGVSSTGEEMPETDWMVTVGDGVMQAASIIAYLKRLALQDWMAFSEKFGTPGIVGRTNAGKGSDAGNAMKDAVENIGADFAAVLYGDDGSGKIEFLSPDVGASALPFPPLIERADRKLVILYRGADLSTMSSKEGKGTGASVQGEETDVLDRDDATIISETLNQVERTVIAWHHGHGAEPLAGIKLIVPPKQDMNLLLNVITGLVDRGAPFEVADVLSRFGFSVPKEGAELLTKLAKEKATAFNERAAATEAAFAHAVWQDMSPAAKALARLLDAKTDDELRERALEINQQFPQLTQAVLNNDAATELLARLAGEEMTQALTQS